MTSLSLRTTHDDLANAMARVAEEGERIVLECDGKPVAALVSVEDVQLLEDLEHRTDLEEAREALAEPGDNSLWETVKAKAGLE